MMPLHLSAAAATLPRPLCLAPADLRAGKAPSAPPIAEIVSFRLLPDTDETAFLAAARATGAPVSARPGFLRRSLSRGDDGLWTDYVEWRDLASAQAAAEAVVSLPEFAAFVAAIDPSEVTMRHAPVLWRMGD
jgi:hypothetical protein